MNGLTVSELCCLFCCPPCPAQIVAKLAFLPPQPTYKLIINGDQTYPNSNGTPEPFQANGQSPSTNQTTATSQTNRVPLPNSGGSGGLSSLLDSLRMSTRRLCSTIVCAQMYSMPQNVNGGAGSQGNQLLQQLHTNAKIVMMDKAEWQYGPVELEKLETFLTRTDRGHQIACLFVRCTNTPKYTILFR